MTQVTTNERVPDRDLRGDVYYNLQVGGLSIVDRRPGSDTYGNVVKHAEQAWITGAEVVIYEGKRQQAVEDDRKNVHAMFRGSVQTYGDFTTTPNVDPIEINYHANKEGCFYDRRGRQLLEADGVIIEGKRILAIGPTFA